MYARLRERRQGWMYAAGSSSDLLSHPGAVGFLFTFFFGVSSVLSGDGARGWALVGCVGGCCCCCC